MDCPSLIQNIMPFQNVHRLCPTLRNLVSCKIINCSITCVIYSTSGYWKAVASLRNKVIGKTFCVCMIISLGRPGFKPCLHQSQDAGPQGREERYHQGYAWKPPSPEFFICKVGLEMEPHRNSSKQIKQFKENHLAIHNMPGGRRHSRAGLRFSSSVTSLSTANLISTQKRTQVHCHSL